MISFETLAQFCYLEQMLSLTTKGYLPQAGIIYIDIYNKKHHGRRNRIFGVNKPHRFGSSVNYSYPRRSHFYKSSYS